ncbi:MAG: hypothetical protein EZS28_056463, partial [Streblomastix strix]
SPHDKSRRNKSIRIYEREKEYAIDNGKRMKKKRLEVQLFEAEAKKKQSSSSSSSSSGSSSNSQEIKEDWTGEKNTVVP